MHATPHTNLFGITTHYGTHPEPPKPRTALERAGVHVLAGALVGLRLVRRVVTR